MTRILTISCDDEFYDLVEKYTLQRGINRSMFVRDAVKTAMRGAEKLLGPLEHKSPPAVRKMRDDGKCNPFLRSGKCKICWPIEVMEEE
jgi:hypothetical protein